MRDEPIGRRDGDADAGDPLPELAGLSPEPSPDFEERVMRSIRLRESMAYSVGFAVSSIADIIRSVVDWMATLGRSDVNDNEGRADE